MKTEEIVKAINSWLSFWDGANMKTAAMTHNSIMQIDAMENLHQFVMMTD